MSGSEKIFSGVLLVRKDKDCTSHQIVDEVRQILKQRPVGHAGSLDPMARGLLVILCGTATKLSSFFTNSDKRYQLSIKFGVETSTFDIQGEVVNSQPVDLEKEELRKLLQAETRELEIPVPIYSAMKLKGRRLYSYAFAGKGEEIEPPMKRMSFWDLDIHEIQKDSVCLSVTCSKGSYIRSWAHYLGQKIGTGACLSGLERLSSGDFSVENSLTTTEIAEKLSKKMPEDEEELKALLGKSFLFTAETLSQFKAIELTAKNARFLQAGRLPVWLVQKCMENQIKVNQSGEAEILKAICDKRIVALLEMQPFKKIRILKNFPFGIKSTSMKLSEA